MKTNLINSTSTSRLILTATIAAPCAFTILSARVHASALAYTVTDLGNLGVAGALALGVNDSGQVAGYAFTPGFATHAVQFAGVGDLGSFNGFNSYGYGINASGQVAGVAQNIFGGYDAVRWTGTTPTILGSLGGTSTGYGINASGQVVGYSQDTLGGYHAVVWTGTTPTDLGTANPSSGFGINDSGDVIGTDGTTAFLYTGGTRYDLFSLLVPGSGVTSIGFGDGGGRFGNGIK